MKSRTLNRIISILFLLLTSYFSLFTSVVYAQDRPFDSASFGRAQDRPFDSAQGQLLSSTIKAGYPTLLKNGFIEEVDSREGQLKTNRNSDVKEQENYFIQKGLHLSLSLGLGIGYHYLSYETSYLKFGPVLEVVTDYWFNDYVAVGMEMGYQYISGISVDIDCHE